MRITDADKYYRGYETSELVFQEEHEIVEERS